MCADNDCGHCRILTQANARRAHRSAEKVVLGFVAVLILGHLAGFIRSIEVTLACVGALVIAALVVYLKLVRPFRHALARQAAGAQLPYRQQPPIRQPQQQALAGPQVHHHHGHTLVVTDPEQLAQFTGRRNRQDGR